MHRFLSLLWNPERPKLREVPISLDVYRCLNLSFSTNIALNSSNKVSIDGFETNNVSVEGLVDDS